MWGAAVNILKYNDENVKGNIDIDRHIDLNIPFVGNAAYNLREFSYDNGLTELVRRTIEFIKGKPYGNRILSNVRDEVKLIINANERVIAGAKYKPIDNIYSKDYLQLLAYMFRFDAKTGYYLYPES